MSGLCHGYLSSCNVVVIVSPKFDLNLVVPNYISTLFLEHKYRSLALRDKLEFIPLKVSLLCDKWVPATTAWHVWPPT